MTDEPPKDQQEKRPEAESHELAPRPREEKTWEMVLERAGRAELAEPAPAPLRPPSGTKYLRWLKALTPVAVLLLYLAYKVASGWGGSDSGSWIRPTAQEKSLTGVEAAQEEPVSMGAEVKKLVARLEALQFRNQWNEIKQVVGAETRPEVRDHPVVQAFLQIARSRMGERSGELTRELARSEALLNARGKDYRNLISELQISRAEQLVFLSNTEENLSRNMNALISLLGEEIDTPHEERVRIQLARNIEDMADRHIEKGDGYLTDDLVSIGLGRTYYQSALKWIVDPKAWYELKPISDGARADLARILVKLQKANRLMHGPSLPLTGSDSTTWSGRKGTPVHDNPPGGAR